ncbi:hypothetical protein ACPV4W_05055 [Vibrio diabolicus]|uniref:hypothetical protein n=1 Tax=Vibrio diabolicus TaxID=50719 RepID=UPI0040680AAD
MAKILLVVMEKEYLEGTLFPIIEIRTIDSNEVIYSDFKKLKKGDDFKILASQGAENLYKCISSTPVNYNSIEGHEQIIKAYKISRLCNGPNNRVC